MPDNECEHDKCYASFVFTTSPPQYPWICRKCGATGRDWGASIDMDEYNRLIMQKAKGEENAR